MHVPQTMKAVQIMDEHTRELRVHDVEMPRPGPGDVLIKVAAAPINPSDAGFLQGRSSYRQPTYPTTLGFEGSGTVVAAGSGLLARMRLGKEVGFAARLDSGTWAEYALARATACIPKAKQVSLEQASMSIINPVTAWAFIHKLRKAKASGAVNNAAASVLGRMLWRMGQTHDLTIINVVRREEQVAMLKAEGREYVLNSSADDFVPQLSELCRKMDIRHAFDAVMGSSTNMLLKCLPNGSNLTIYGALSREPSAITYDQILYREIIVEGYLLSNWLRQIPRLTILRAMREISQLLAGELHSPIRSRFGLEQFEEALKSYNETMTGGKVLFVP